MGDRLAGKGEVDQRQHAPQWMLGVHALLPIDSVARWFGLRIVYPYHDKEIMDMGRRDSEIY